MAESKSVAEMELPGKVLLPNAPDEFADGQENVLEQFGEELQNPNAAPPLTPFSAPKPKQPASQPNEVDVQRYEHWQSKAQKAEDKLKEVELKLAEKAKMDPLLDVLQKDKEAYEYLQNRLNGNRTPEKPLEPPQKPNSYNEVEAYSNPESASFKYRNDLDTYRDMKLQQLEKQNSALYQARDQEKQLLERQAVEREKLMQFRTEVISKGIPEERFGEFLGLVNNANADDMVDYWKYKQSRSPEPENISQPRFDVYRTPSVSPGKKTTDNLNIGNDLIALTRNLR
jgi:hypothetical protein